MDAEGNGESRDINLGERISNENGQFVFSEYLPCGMSKTGY